MRTQKEEKEEEEEEEDKMFCLSVRETTRQARSDPKGIR